MSTALQASVSRTGAFGPLSWLKSILILLLFVCGTCVCIQCVYVDMCINMQFVGVSADTHVPQCVCGSQDTLRCQFPASTLFLRQGLFVVFSVYFS